MDLLKAIHITKSHGIQNLFENIDFRILEGDSIALVGPNGAGKTSLVRILLGQDEPEKGSIKRKEGLNVGYVPQIPIFRPEQSVEDFLVSSVHEVERQMRQLEEEMGAARGPELESALVRYQHLTERFDAQGGYDARGRGEAALRALGMDNPLDQKLSSLSGGETSLVAFARALVGRPDLLILDEPGNHLDYLGLAWLENFLCSYPGALLVVSHNRYMLDRVSRKLWYLAGGSFIEFAGHYSEFVLRQKQAAILQQHEHLARQRRVAELRRRVKELQSVASASYNPKKTVMVQLAAVKRKLEEEMAADPGRADLDTESIRIELRQENRQGEIAIEIRNLSRSFGSKEVLKGVNLEIHREEKVALVGPNGCGKSTLLQCIVDEGDWNSETIRVGPGYRVGYLSQRSDFHSAGSTLEEEIRSWGPLTREDAFQLVSGMKFAYEDMDKRVAKMSGGELKRLQLARLMYQKADLLILDEPTNHMDILSRDAIEQALQEFTGTLLVVSHDRYFLDHLVRRIIDLDGGTVREYPGNFSDFFRQKYPVLPRMSTRLQDRGKVRKAGAEDRISLGVEELERRIEVLEREKTGLDKELIRCYQNRDATGGRELVRKLEKVQKRLDGLYDEWEKELR